MHLTVKVVWYAMVSITEWTATLWKARCGGADPKRLADYPMWDRLPLARPTQGEEGRSLEYGVCMEMANEQTLRSYASDPAHDAWMQVYSKVRVEGTTTFDVVGQ